MGLEHLKLAKVFTGFFSLTSLLVELAQKIVCLAVVRLLAQGHLKVFSSLLELIDLSKRLSQFKMKLKRSPFNLTSLA